MRTPGKSAAIMLAALLGEMQRQLEEKSVPGTVIYVDECTGEQTPTMAESFKEAVHIRARPEALTPWMVKTKPYNEDWRRNGKCRGRRNK